MHTLLWLAIFILSAAVSLFAACHALLMKRDPRSALGWIVVTLILPVFGPLLYWILGINRIVRTAQRWRKAGRLTDHDVFRSSGKVTQLRSISEAVDTFHLSELRHLSDRIVSASLTTGNGLTAFHNGDQAYPAMLEAIASARHSINLSTYIFDGDSTGRAFVKALAGAAARGVDVRVLVDGLGEKYSHPTARKLLRNSSVEVARFLPMRQGGRLNLRNHRKILVVDGITGFTGGMNIGGRHMVAYPETSSPVVDMHFKVHGPVVADLQKVFLEDWFFVTGELLDEERYFPSLPAVGTARVRAVADGPDKAFRKLHWLVLGALSCAVGRIQIMTPYFIPDRALISALVTTAMRGVDVSLLLPARNNLPLVHWATRSYLWELLQGGVRVYYQPAPFVHTKLLLVDGIWSLIGSANLDPRSLRLNFELNLEIYDREFTAMLERHYQDSLLRSREVFLEEMDSRALPEKLRDGAAKLLSPFL